jgi:hypothetical protein
MQACKITWVVLMNCFLDSQAEKMSGGKDLKHNIGHIDPLEHSIEWLRPEGSVHVSFALQPQE